MLDAVTQFRKLLFPDAAPEAGADREFMLDAVTQFQKLLLPDAAPEAGADREFMLDAVTQFRKMLLPDAFLMRHRRQELTVSSCSRS